MDIEIKNPINISFDVVEIDEHIPSIRFNVTVKLKKFCYILDVSSQLWVECQCFDVFVKNIRNNNLAALKDINNSFELLFDPFHGWLEWVCSKEDLDGYVTSARGREKLTEELKNALFEAFNDYPKWW